MCLVKGEGRGFAFLSFLSLSRTAPQALIRPSSSSFTELPRQPPLGTRLFTYEASHHDRPLACSSHADFNMRGVWQLLPQYAE